MPRTFGFSPVGYNQIVIFLNEEEFRKIVSANPRMTAIIQDSGHKIYVAGIKAEAS